MDDTEPCYADARQAPSQDPPRDLHNTDKNEGEYSISDADWRRRAYELNPSASHITTDPTSTSPSTASPSPPDHASTLPATPVVPLMRPAAAAPPLQLASLRSQVASSTSHITADPTSTSSSLHL